MFLNHPGLELLLSGTGLLLLLLTRCNTDVKQFSETVVIQQNISLAIHKNAKSYTKFEFIQ